MDTWKIIETAFSPATAKAFEGLFTLGSGCLHVRGSLEEHLFDAPQSMEFTRKPANVTAERFPETRAKWGTYVPGIFARHPLLNEEMVNLPWFLDLAPFAGNEKLDMERSRIEAYERVLDMRAATLARTIRWKTRAGPVITVRFERFVSLARPSLCVQRLVLTSDRKGVVTVRAGIDADVRTSGYDHLESIELARDGGQGVRCRAGVQGGGTVTMLARLSGPAAAWRLESAPRRARLATELQLRPGRTVVVEKRTAVATSRDLVPQEPHIILDAAAGLTFDDLLAEHAAAWAARWERCDVIVEGNDASQQALRCSLYHLLRAHVPGDARVAVDAKGYSGDAYFGRFFWDTEMFLLPFYIYTDPERARTLVDFRVTTLPGARSNAAFRGERGARYAWESDAEGRERCPNPQYADNEIHVTADVVHGIAHFARAVDARYLEGPAAEVVVEAARFWMDRIETGEDGRPHLRGVMGPDEYTPACNDNAYTNRLAAFSLELVSRMGARGGAGAAELRAFADAAASLPVLRGRDGALVLQCEGFEELDDPPFDALWLDRARPFAAQVDEEVLHRSRCLKQADVLMLMALFPDEFSDEEARAAWDYYVPCTTHDSSLSPGIHAVMAARLGLREEAWDFWQRSAFLDLDVERAGAGSVGGGAEIAGRGAEIAGGSAEGVHISACGGNWQAAVLGFAGMRTALQSDTFSLSPRLPAAWTRLAFPVIWKGAPLFIDITPGQCIVSNRGANDLLVTVSGCPASVPARPPQPSAPSNTMMKGP